MEKFDFLMISAGFEHGGNVTHRLLDGHPEMYVYPFESQIGNKFVNDLLTSIERTQYRYPVFPIGLSLDEYYELFYDEELKTFLRKPNGSKFKNCGLEMNEDKRKQEFKKFFDNKPINSANLIQAFFVSTFKAWENYNISNENRLYVGYSPAIGIDSERIISDFPNVKILHIIRNPFSAYANTKMRPYPFDINRYIRTWNIYHSTVQVFEEKYPENIKIVRFEDIVNSTEETMRNISKFVGVKFNKSMLLPSFNSNDISNNISPWGAVQKSTGDYNIEVAKSLDIKEINSIYSYVQKNLMNDYDYMEIYQELKK